MPNASVAVGTSLPRVDGVGKVTGAARYVDDLQPHGALFGRTVRSTTPHARLTALEQDPAFDWTGITVVTAADIPGENVILLIEEDQPCLVPIGGVIRHVEEAVALVAAPTKARAEAARKAITVVTEPRTSWKNWSEIAKVLYAAFGSCLMRRKYA